MTAPSGTIKSEGFPNPYTGPQNCQWNIAVTVGKKIKIVFDKKFQLPPKQESCSQFVKLGNFGGPTSLFYCGKNLPPDFISKGNKVKVSFKVEANTGNYTGFSLNYTTYEEATSTPAPITATAIATNITTSISKSTALPNNKSTTGMKRLPLNSNIVLMDCKWEKISNS